MTTVSVVRLQCSAENALSLDSMNFASPRGNFFQPKARLEPGAAEAGAAPEAAAESAGEVAAEAWAALEASAAVEV